MPKDNQFGISLKSVYYDEIIMSRPEVDFFEIHAENYMMPAGPHWRYLDQISDIYAISVHGVGLSLGSADGLDASHLNRFAALINRLNPAVVSEHLAWSVQNGIYLNDLLPLPLTAESLTIVSDNIQRVQDKIGCQLLVENPSTYMAFKQSDIPEPDYLMQLAHKTGCGILLDVNNIYVSAQNTHFKVDDYLSALDYSAVKEIHLAGHTARDYNGHPILIDDHGSPVCDAVWALYASICDRLTDAYILVERDSNLPPLEDLVAEAFKAKQLNSAEQVPA